MSIDRHLGEVLPSVLGSAPAQGVNQPGFFDSVADRQLDNKVGDPERYGGAKDRCSEPENVDACEGGVYVHTPSLCTPPAENAAALSDGSAKAGPGACTSLEWVQLESRAMLVRYYRVRFCECRDAGLRASARRYKSSAEFHERFLRAYADALL